MTIERSAEKLWARVVKLPSGCWEWQGARGPSGYGQIRIPGDRNVATHRLAYELANGEISAGLLVCHTCDNPPCCNPDHLWLGTHVDNAVDMVRKGRTNNLAGPAHHNVKLTFEQVAEIRRRYVLGMDWRRGTGCSAVELADEFGVSKAYIWMLANNWWREAA